MEEEAARIAEENLLREEAKLAQAT